MNIVPPPPTTTTTTTTKKSPKTRLNPQMKVNVGGTIFTTSKSTLIAYSSYFESRLSEEWNTLCCEDDGEIPFIDQDPEAFRPLLGFMRNGFIEASELTKTVLVLADFLGMGFLLNAVKCAAFRYMHNVKSHTMTTDEICLEFDIQYGGIVPAIRRGILPDGIRPSDGPKEYACLLVDENSEMTLTNEMTRTRNLSLETLLVDSPEDLVGSWEGAGFFLESLNWLHKHGFVMKEDEDGRLERVFPEFDSGTCEHFLHLWFSRSYNTENKDDTEEQLVLFENDHQPMTCRKEFAALVYCHVAPGLRLSNKYVLADVGEETEASFYSLENPNREVAMSKISIIENDPVSWLGRNGYHFEEKYFGKIFQRITNRAARGDERDAVRVFSRSI